MPRENTTRRRLVLGTFPAGDPFPGLSWEKVGKHIDDHFGMPGCPFEVICAALGGLRYYDLEITVGGAIHAYHLWVANAGAFGLKEGFRAENIVNHIRLRKATAASWNYPMAA